MQTETAAERLAALVGRRWEGIGADDVESIQALFGAMRAVGRETKAIERSASRILARVGRQDLGQLGFRSWTAFVKEVAPWKVAPRKPRRRQPRVFYLSAFVSRTASAGRIDLHLAVARLRAMNHLLDHRRDLVGQACLLVFRHNLWRFVPGEESREMFFRVNFDMRCHSFFRHLREYVPAPKSPQAEP